MKGVLNFNMYALADIYQRKPVLIIFLACIMVLYFYYLYGKEKLNNPQIKDKYKPPALKKGDPSHVTGIIFGRKRKKVYYSSPEEEGHVFCCAASGMGKTSALAIPSIRAFGKNVSQGTCFCIDISGDLSSQCKLPNSLIFDIENPDTIPYNIFAAIDNASGSEIQNELLEKLAFLIMPEVKSNDGAASFFQKNGRNMLIGALIAYYHCGLDFVPICKRIISMDYKKLLYDIVETQNKDAIKYIASFSGSSEKNSAGCKQCMDDYIKLYATNFRMKYAVRRPVDTELCITPQLLKNHNLFLCVPDAKTDVYGPLLGIITAQAFDYCAARKNGEKPSVLFVLDEFASLRLSPNTILDAIRKYRKKCVRVMILTQALIDLDILYDEKIRNAILSNVKYKVVLGITDPASQKYFADIVGQREQRVQSTSINGNTTTVSYSTKKEYRISPEKFGQLKDDLYLICDDGTYGKYKKNYYFQKY